MAAEASFLTGMFLSLRSYGNARDAYQNFGVDDALAVYNQQNSIADVRSELDTRFDRFQSKSKQVNTMIALAVGVWAINIVDTLIFSLRRDYLYAQDTSGQSSRGFVMDWDTNNRQWGIKYGLSW